MVRSKAWPVLSLWLLLLALAVGVRADGGRSNGDQPLCITDALNSTGGSSYLVAKAQHTTHILTSRDDAPAVHIAVKSFAQDIRNAVPGAQVEVRNITSASWLQSKRPASLTLIVGTLDTASLVNSLTNSSAAVQSEAERIRGKWEAWSTTLTEDESSLVLLGSDRRGTIFSLYTLSEQMGISPWHWFADVPPRDAHEAVYYAAQGTCRMDSPHVKYRGIFLNDEAPALTNWARKHFNGPLTPESAPQSFGPEMYAQVFELLLRLKANYLWPAMWSDSFGVAGLDDLPAQGKGAAGPNLLLAERMGIVMGTSHQEPMARNTPEWNTWGSGDWDFQVNADNLTEFWRYGAERSADFETVYTVGMRGNGDIALEGASVKLLENIVDVQRDLLPSNASQLWCMYKEVQGWYEQGLNVPDDIILLWTDDNWGQIRRIPSEEEKSRSGGSGLYYHGLDYVGDPRNYKWINANNLMTTWEQLNVAFSNEQTELFIVNVGDLKPFEMPISFMMEMALEPSRMSDPDMVMPWLQMWCERTFTTKEMASELAQVIYGYSELNARIKPELVNATTWSLTHYREADRVLERWSELEAKVSSLEQHFKGTERWAAFFQLVSYPTLASANLNRLYIAVGKNNLRSRQSANVANAHAAKARHYFRRDYELTREYHELLGGKWDHMMSQPHINYVYWQQPMRNSLPALNFLETEYEDFPDSAQSGNLRVTIDGSEGAWPGDNEANCELGYNCADPTLPRFSRYQNKLRRSIYLSPGDSHEVQFAISSNTSWLSFEPAQGGFGPGAEEEQEIKVHVDWDSVPASVCSPETGGDIVVASVSINSTTDKFAGISKASPVRVLVEVDGCWMPNSTAAGVFVPSAPAPEAEMGYISMLASSAKVSDTASANWKRLPRYGLIGSAMTVMPPTAPSLDDAAPCLEWTFFWPKTEAGSVNATVWLAPTLNYRPGRPLRYKLDAGAEAVEVEPVGKDTKPGAEPADWFQVTAENVRRNTTEVGFGASPDGTRTLRLCALEPGLVVEKVVLGSAPASALGPPESGRV